MATSKGIKIGCAVVAAAAATAAGLTALYTRPRFLVHDCEDESFRLIRRLTPTVRCYSVSRILKELERRRAEVKSDGSPDFHYRAWPQEDVDTRAKRYYLQRWEFNWKTMKHERTRQFCLYTDRKYLDLREAEIKAFMMSDFTWEKFEMARKEAIKRVVPRDDWWRFEHPKSPKKEHLIIAPVKSATSDPAATATATSALSTPAAAEK